MKSKKLSQLKDGQIFRLSKRSSVFYSLQKKLKAKDKGYAYITSESSQRTFCKHLDTVVYI